jgi:ribosomal protein L16/L10AE
MSIFQIQRTSRKGDIIMTVSSVAVPRRAAKKTFKKAAKKLLMNWSWPVYVKLVSRLVTYSGK